MHRFFVLFFVAMLASAADLKTKLDEIVSASPSLAGAFIGLQIVSLKSGEILYDRNADHLFTPASNTKLFTTALALVRLGPDYRMTTQIAAACPIGAGGTLACNLVFVGGGDPSLSGRVYPYQKVPAANNYSFHAVEELADRLIARGLKRIDGDIVGDDRRYVWAPYPAGWAIGDATFEYGAPVSALILDDNSFALTLSPGSHAGDPAQISLAPPFEYLSIDNRVRTVPEGTRAVEFRRAPASRQVHAWGTIGAADPGLTQLLAVDDPARYAAEALRDALQRRGVAIRGQAIARHRLPDQAEPSGDPEPSRVVLVERTSPPLAQLLQVTDKVSQNLHAEVMLREVAAAENNVGSRESGLHELEKFLTSIGISKEDFRFSDGSGLSRDTLVTPAAIVKLLAYMYNSKQRDVWLSLLPVAGVDGTLASRFGDHPEAHAIHAKTGTLAHVRANSGYADSPVFGPLAFSFVINDYDTPTAGINRFLDAIELAMLQ